MRVDIRKRRLVAFNDCVDFRIEVERPHDIQLHWIITHNPPVGRRIFLQPFAEMLISHSGLEAVGFLLRVHLHRLPANEAPGDQN